MTQYYRNMTHNTPQMFQRCTLCGGRQILLIAKGGLSFARYCDCATDSNTGKYECRDCSGEGFMLLEDKNGYGYRKNCACQEIEARVKKFNDASIPQKFFDVSIETYVPSSERQSNALRYTEAFLQKDLKASTGFVLMGPCGVGKTHLLVSVLKSLILDKGYSCIFVDFFHLLQSIRHCYSARIPETVLLDRLIDVKILAIDELGKGRRDSEWEQQVLDQVISKRYNMNKTTLFTTNYTLDQTSTYPSNKFPATGSFKTRFAPPAGSTETLKDRVGERIYSRVCEMCDFVLLDGEDYRKVSQQPGS